jgi:acyl-CoA reductase-like NAD-dependent aldehyde dehydrogenase
MNNDDATPDRKELLNQEFKLLINGELTSGESKEFMETVDPSNGEIIAKIPNASIIDVNNTIAAAKKAQKKWALTSLEERQNSVLEIAKI